jgi:glycine C-acetyltransferase
MKTQNSLKSNIYRYMLIVFLILCKHNYFLTTFFCIKNIKVLLSRHLFLIFNAVIIMFGKLQEYLQAELKGIKDAGLYKNERIIVTPQSVDIKVNNGQEVLNFCANNYLGLSSHPAIIKAAHEALDRYGFGMSSVRFICGTQDVHKELEARIAKFFGTEDTILYAACFDANGGVFEPLLSAEDAIISDSLNHASIIDGVRLCKAARYRYANADMNDLETQLKEAQKHRFRLIVTDAVFSMDGNIAPLDKICELAEKYDALVMIDECHSAGVVGATGRGITEMFDLMGKVDIITGTLGKALGGGIGGFTTGRKEIIEMLRQRSRPYLFSNSIPPSIAAAGIAAIDLLETSTVLQNKLAENTKYFVEGMTKLQFDIKPTQSAIVAVMLYDAPLSQVFAERLLQEGIYVVGFYFPVVPKQQARIRVQLSAAHTKEHLDKALAAFDKIRNELSKNKQK